MLNIIFFSGILFAQPINNLQTCLMTEARIYVEAPAVTGRMKESLDVDRAYDAIVNNQHQFCTEQAMTLTGKNTQSQMVAEICHAIEMTLLKFLNHQQVDALFSDSEACRRLRL